MQVRKYEWADHFRPKADAQAVGKAIEQLRKSLGREDDDLTPAELVAFASDSSSPLHGLFTWDDAKAAHLQRENEARLVLRSIRIVVVSSGKEQRIIGNVSVRTESSGSSRVYVPMPLAVHKENLRTQMIESAISGLNGWRSRYEQLQGATEALAHVEKAIGVLKQIRVNKRPEPPAASAI